MEAIINRLEFKPLVAFSQFGNEIQRCETMYKNVPIMMETFIPWNIFKNPTDTYLVDRIVKSDSKIKGATIDCNRYTENGYGYPVFKTIEGAINYIDSL